MDGAPQADEPTRPWGLAGRTTIGRARPVISRVDTSRWWWAGADHWTLMRWQTPGSPESVVAADWTRARGVVRGPGRGRADLLVGKKAEGEGGNKKKKEKQPCICHL